MTFHSIATCTFFPLLLSDGMLAVFVSNGESGMVLSSKLCCRIDIIKSRALALVSSVMATVFPLNAYLLAT